MKVKICGITHPEDAAYAASQGADYIGIIFAPSSRRSVNMSQAKEIIAAAKENGAEPIAVFVDETADQIIHICEALGIKIVQLHGYTSRQAALSLEGYYSLIYACPVELNGEIDFSQIPSNTMTCLFDCLGGGTGTSFDWNVFSASLPKVRRWILAGGLTPNNLAEAIALLSPHGVDVATGVEHPSSIRKDPELVKKFLQIAKQKKEPI